MRTIILTAAALAAMSGTASSQVIQWNNSAGGLWNDVTNWTPGAIPDSLLESASIALPGAYTVNLNININPLGGLSITNPAATVALDAGRNLTMNGPVINDGLFIVNPTASAVVTDLAFDAPISLLIGSGTLRLNAFGVRARMTSGPGATIEHGSGHTIDGYGDVVADFANAGTIRANSPGNTLTLRDSATTNSGSIGAGNTGVLDINNSVLIQDPAGVLIADGGTVLLGGSTTMGGTIDAINGGIFRLDGVNTLDGLTLDGDVILDPGGRIDTMNGLENNAVLTINNTSAAVVTTLQIKNSMQINGVGSVRLNGLNVRSQILTDPGATLTIPAGQLIGGWGRITADLVSMTDIDADTEPRDLQIFDCTIDNQGRLRGLNNGTLDIDGSVITQSSGGRIVADGGSVRIATADITGGSIDSINGGNSVFDGSSDLTDVTFNGPTVLNPGLLLDLFGSFTNNGDFLVNPTAAATVTTLSVHDSMPIGGNGTVILNGINVRAQILTDPGVTLTLPASQTLRGYGRLTVDMINQSDIDADVGPRAIEVLNSSVTNQGRIRALNAGTIDIDGSTIDQNASALIVADGGSVRISTSTITGGTIDTINGGDTVFDGATTIDAVTLDGDATLNPGLQLSVRTGLENNGVLLINPTAAATVTSLVIKDSMPLAGSGTVLLNGINVRAQILTDPGVTLTLPGTQFVRGYGRITADLVNLSDVDADASGKTLDVLNSTIDNQGRLRAINSATLDLDGSSVTQSPGGVIVADAGSVRFATTDITGGSIVTINAGDTVFDGSSSVEDLAIDGDSLVNPGVNLTLRGTVENNGTLTVNANNGAIVTNVTIDGAVSIAGTGEIALRGDNVRSQFTPGTDAALTQGTGHTISGIGRIGVPMTNHGTLAPGLSVGVLEANAPVTFTSTAELDVEVAGDNNADLLDSTSTFEAAGTLRVTFVDGFDPNSYWDAPVVIADAGVTGRFDTVVAPVPSDSRLIIRACYLPNEIRIGAICKPDINCDGQLNFFDISTFISLYNVQDPDADISAPFGVWNFFDIATYIGQYNTGCP